MSKLNITRTQDLLQKFDFEKLFIEELGWSKPGSKKTENKEIFDIKFSFRQIAELAGVVALEISTSEGKIPDAKTRKAIHKELSKTYHENLLIFIDKDKTQSIWYWVKREDGKSYPRDHSYFKGQPGDLFISKLSGIVFDISDFEKTGDISVVEVARRLKNALDVERVTKRFYGEFQDQHLAFLELIEGIDDDRERHWYASVLLNRLMFIYFLQKKRFLDNGNLDYLQTKLAESKVRGKNLFFSDFLILLFFEGFAKPENQRSSQALKLLGKIKYLNGGLFLPHIVELKYPKIHIPDKAFENVLNLFQRYSWNLNDTPGGEDNEINPDVLGYIFEKYINQKAFGAYYTRPEITEYLCEKTIQHLVLDRVNTPGIPGAVASRQFETIGDLLLNLDTHLCKRLLFDILPEVSILDPACGSGAFLVAAMKSLIGVYSALIGKIKFLGDKNLTKWLKDIEDSHPSSGYYIKKAIITDNLFGVDIMDEAVEIAKLRLFLALVAAANSVEDLEPLPNIDFNIQAGNSLIGLIRVDASAFERNQADPAKKQQTKKKDQDSGQMSLLFDVKESPGKKDAQAAFLAERSQQKYNRILQEKNRLIKLYRHATDYADDLRSLRDQITAQKQSAVETLNSIILDEFHHLEIKYEQAAWDEKEKCEGKTIKRPLRIEDIQALKPFHWGFEFDEIIGQGGGFDAIITNPPWEIFKPNAKEFFEQYSDLVSKKKMTIKDFEEEQEKLLKDHDIRKAWFEYLNKYPHVSAYFRSAPQYKNQISIVDGKKVGTDINLYKLFTEQCFNLLRKGGYCGIVIPSGIYTDLGSKQLREMLFAETQLTGLFCFENRKEIFEGVHRSFKFVVLTFETGLKTDSFPAAFMRHDVEELDGFPQEGSVKININLVRRLSPDSLSVMEFKESADVEIAEKMLQFPLLGDEIQNGWSFRVTREFDMTNDSSLFKTSQGNGNIQLLEGKMMWQFQSNLSVPRFWVNEKKGRAALLGRTPDKGQLLGYQKYRLAYRSIASNTNERTLVCTIIPPSFTGNSLNMCDNLDELTQLYCTGLFNSFVIDWFLRQKVTTNINMFFIYQLPIPRLTDKDKTFIKIAKLVAKLVCTEPEFNELGKVAGLKSHKDGVTNSEERIKIRAELDGIIAHLYEVSEDEFAHILATFLIVPQNVKDATLDAYKKIASAT
ncbi:MAG: DNA methyltransferase [Candidatus Omnitrophota bacterium]